jgi:hypothetical protein
VDTSKERPQEEMVEDVVLYHNRRSTMGDREWSDQWKVPVADKKGTKGKEQAGTRQSSSPTFNTRKASECTHPTECRVIIKKKRRKETLPRALVLGTRASILGTEYAKGTNGEAQKNDNIPNQEVESGDLPKAKNPM